MEKENTLVCLRCKTQLPEPHTTSGQPKATICPGCNAILVKFPNEPLREMTASEFCFLKERKKSLFLVELNLRRLMKDVLQQNQTAEDN